MAKSKLPKKAGKAPAKRPRGRKKGPRFPHNAAWLKSQFLIAGITQRDISLEMGVDYATVNHFVTGRRPLKEAEAAVLARMLKMPLQAFLAKVRSTEPQAIPAGLERAVEAGELEITGWVDGKLTVHEGKPKGPSKAPTLPDADAVKVLRCQTQGSDFDGIDGALVYYRETPQPASANVGRMCVATLPGGKRVLRVVKRGYTEGKFNLSMLNGASSEEDVDIRAAHPVIWLKL